GLRQRLRRAFQQRGNASDIAAGRSAHPFELRDGAGAARREDGRGIRAGPAQPYTGDDDSRLEHTEGGGHDLGLDLAEQRSPAREVGRSVGSRDALPEGTGARIEAELLVGLVTLRREE